MSSTICEKKIETIISNSLEKARYYNVEKNYGRSFGHYLVIFELLIPNERQQYENEFMNVLRMWSSILHSGEKYEELFRCYRLAINYFPTSVEILNNYASHLLKLKCYQMAKTYLQSCLNIDSNYLPAEQNLQISKQALVERWHFSMLNDTKRNKSYAETILMEISNGFTQLLDIGTGTGILSLFAASKHQQCTSITACDCSDSMCEIALNVFNANNVGNSINLIAKQSNQLRIPDDMESKATLVVTEILDSGVFGEDILETLIDAWDHLLLPHPFGKVIPAACTIYMTGFCSEQLVRKMRVQPRVDNLLQLNDICLTCIDRPYDSEHLKTMNATYVTNVEKILDVNFNDVNQLRVILETTTAKGPQQVAFKCVEDGCIDAFALWFTLHLNDAVHLTNNPQISSDETASCWDQAVYQLRHPLQVVKHQEFELNISLCSDGIIEHKGCNCNQYCYSTQKSTIMFLNDSRLIECLKELSTRLLDQYKDVQNLRILDINPFPIVGLLMLCQQNVGGHLTCRCCIENDAPLRALCELNGITIDQITLVNELDFNDSDSCQFDIIIQNVIDPDGFVLDTEIYQAQVLKYCVTARGLYVPNKVIVWAQLVESAWLEQVTRVDDRNVCGFKIAQFINEYQTREQQDLIMEQIEHSELSAPINLGMIQYDTTKPYVSKKANIPIICDGVGNAIFYWFEIQFIEDLHLTTRRLESFVHNSAFILETPCTFNKGQLITLCLKQHQGLLKIFVA